MKLILSEQQVILLGLLENNIDPKQEVLSLIHSNKWETDVEAFAKSLYQSKHVEMLTPYSNAELSQMKLYKVPGYNIGYALKKFKNLGYKDIVAVHNNEPEIKGLGEELVKSAIQNGGCYLDHYDGYLSSFYEKLGFVEYDRNLYDSQYDPEGKFKNKYGESDVIYRYYKGCKKPI